MTLFNSLYARVLHWSGRPQAVYFLSLLSCIEAFIFPVPPEAMLLPMGLNAPRKAFHYAHISLLFSLIGALIGYMLGHTIFQWVSPLLDQLHLLEPILDWVTKLKTAIQEHPYGVLMVLLVAAVQPIVPMKFVTWASGIVGVPIWAFIACMALGRAKRVYLVAWLIRRYGGHAEQLIRRHIEHLGWLVTIGVAVLALWWFFR